MENLAGKVAFITGGVSGIGLGIARAALTAGMKVIVTYRREDSWELAQKNFAPSDHVLALQLDVTDRSALSRAADTAEHTFGKIHLLCNNAGVNLFGRIDCSTFEDWEWIVGVNLMGVVNGVITFLPRIKAHGEGGHILNVASMAAFLVSPQTGIYSASKAAVWALSESLRDCLAPHNIGVSILFPGLVNTDIHQSNLNRPANLANSGTRNDAMVTAVWREMQAMGMEPTVVGELALQGIHLNQRYIFTHPEFKDWMRAHFNAILSGLSGLRDDRSAEADTLRRAVASKMHQIASLCDRHPDDL